jgi:ribosomal protein L24
MPIDASNVAIYSGGKPSRVGYRYEGAGAERKKVRYAKATGEALS